MLFCRRSLSLGWRSYLLEAASLAHCQNFSAAGLSRIFVATMFLRRIIRLLSDSLRYLPQDFAQFFPGRCHITFFGACNAKGQSFSRPRERTVEPTFAGYQFEDCGGQKDAA